MKKEVNFAVCSVPVKQTAEDQIVGLNFYSVVQCLAVKFVLFIFQLLPSTFVIWMLYSVTIAVSFAVIKLVNHRLHHMYDTSEVVEDEEEEEESTDEADKAEETSKTSETGTSKNPTQG